LAEVPVGLSEQATDLIQSAAAAQRGQAAHAQTGVTSASASRLLVVASLLLVDRGALTWVALSILLLLVPLWRPTVTLLRVSLLRVAPLLRVATLLRIALCTATRVAGRCLLHLGTERGVNSAALSCSDKPTRLQPWTCED